MLTQKFVINVGVNPGYSHKNEIKDPVKHVIEKLTFYTVPYVVFSSKTVYNYSWGCPLGGEDTVVITGIRNPKYDPDYETWKVKVLEFASRIKGELGQSTLYLSFEDVKEFIYL